MFSMLPNPPVSDVTSIVIPAMTAYLATTSGAFLLGKLAPPIVKTLLGKTLPVAASAAVFGTAWWATYKFEALEKRREAILAGTGIAFTQAIMAALLAKLAPAPAPVAPPPTPPAASPAPAQVPSSPSAAAIPAELADLYDFEEVDPSTLAGY